MSDSGRIKIGAHYNARNPLQGGLTDRLILYNYDEVLSYTTDAQDRITSITLQNGASGYAYNGFKSNNAQDEAVALGSGQTLWKHQISFFIFDISQVQKNNIQAIALGKFVAVIQNTKRDENSFEVYGLNNGLELPPGVIRNHNENNGAFNLTLATRDGQAESKLPQTYFNTDFITSLQQINSTLFLPSVDNVSPPTLPGAGGTNVVLTGRSFFGGIGSSDVQSVHWIDQATQAAIPQTGLTVTDTTISFASVPLPGGAYKLRVATSKAVAESLIALVVA